MEAVFSSNSTKTGTTFDALSPTTTEPSTSITNGAFAIRWRGDVHDYFNFIPFGRNANNLTMKARVTAFTKGSDSQLQPRVISELTATLSSSLTGTSGKTPSNSDLMPDTITIDKGLGIVNASPADDTGVASVSIPVSEDTFVLVVQMIRNGSATEVNGLYSTE